MSTNSGKQLLASNLACNTANNCPPPPPPPRHNFWPDFTSSKNMCIRDSLFWRLMKNFGERKREICDVVVLIPQLSHNFQIKHWIKASVYNAWGAHRHWQNLKKLFENWQSFCPFGEFWNSVGGKSHLLTWSGIIVTARWLRFYIVGKLSSEDLIFVS